MQAQEYTPFTGIVKDVRMAGPRDYDVYVDGEYIGSRATRLEAEGPDAVLGDGGPARPSPARACPEPAGQAGGMPPRHYLVPTWRHAAAFDYRLAGPCAWRGTWGALVALMLAGRGIAQPMAVVFGKRTLTFYDVRADGRPGNRVAVVEVSR